MKAQKFLVVLDDINSEVFGLLNRLNEHLNLACKGRYELNVDFQSAGNNLAQKHGLRGIPAIINLQNQRVSYGQFRDREFLSDLDISS